MSNPILAEALACINRGWAVFPLHNIKSGKCTCNKPQCDSPGKHPRYDYGIIERGVLDASSEEAKIRNWWAKWPKANIGIATGEKSGIVAVDIDPRHSGDESWQKLEASNGKVNTVQSLTGGGGCHYLFGYPKDTKITNGAEIGNNKGVDIRGDGGYIVGPGSDHHSGGRYEWELSSHPDEIPLAPMPEWLIKICLNGNGPKQTTTSPEQPITEGRRNVALTALAGTMRRPGMTQAAILAALMEENRLRCKPPLSDKAVERIAASVSKYPPEPDVMDGIPEEWMVEEIENTDKTDKTPQTLTKLTNEQITDKTDNIDIVDIVDTTDIVDKTYTLTRGRAIWKLVDQWLAEHSGEKFDLDTICRHLDVKARGDRHHVIKKLSYEVSHQALEKSDKLYRSINKEYVIIDWVNASPAPPLTIEWPYGIDDITGFGFDGHVIISPGDIIVLAGVSNMGKSLWCLNLLWNNMDTYPCTLMGNEYEAGKFKRRISKMTWRDPINEDGTPKFELIERYDNWQDIIRPDNINIIDWINLGENFYAIGKIIEKIKSKLRDGIAIIVLQKSEGKPLGTGGDFSQHLASLYLTIDFGRMTVVKAKEWHRFNPNGKWYGFDIDTSGCKFSHIREVIKCRTCNGAGRTSRGECGECQGKTYIELPDSWDRKGI